MMLIKNSKYTDRLLARFVIEARTPIAVGSGDKDIMTDAAVATDINGLPYLPATSIAGVIRSMLKIEDTNKLWGYQLKDEGHGSEIAFTEGKILNAAGEVMDGLRHNVFEDPLLCHYANLPIRQHVSIDDKGTAKKHGKFDEQIVYAGTRFCFEIEIVADRNGSESMQALINSLHHQEFRIGGGTRSGFGEIEVISVQTQHLRLSEAEDMQKYLEKSSSLADEHNWWDGSNPQKCKQERRTTYTLDIHPLDFIMFGSGYSDEKGDADMTTVKASKVDWKSGKGVLQTELTLIPASSVKGALRHRVTYHYNRLNGNWATSAAEVKRLTECITEVDELFGYQNGKDTIPGRVFFSDIIEAQSVQKLLNHVSIDRFTGGAIDGALFTEQVDYAPDRSFKLEIVVKGNMVDKLKEAFEAALDDICEGRLPLGGGVNRGNGIFMGTRTPKKD